MPGGEIGFIGLGIMGRPMVRNLMTAGYSLTVFDVVGSRHGGDGDRGRKARFIFG